MKIMKQTSEQKSNQRKAQEIHIDAKTHFHIPIYWLMTQNSESIIYKQMHIRMKKCPDCYKTKPKQYNLSKMPSYFVLAV